MVAFAFIWMMRYPFKVGLTVAAALAQIGEFSFMLASVGRELGVLTAAATNALVATAMVSIVLNPILFRSVDPIERWAAARPRLWQWLDRSTAPAPTGSRRSRRTSPAHRAILVGYGPTGRTVVRLLAENGIAATVVELNIDTVRSLRDEGVDAIYGDATHPDTLAEAQIGEARHLILTSAGMEHSAEVIRAARSLSPDIRILARTVYLRELAPLSSAGADSVYAGEGEVALAFVEDILARLGATAEQIDRERARAHDELFGRA